MTGNRQGSPPKSEKRMTADRRISVAALIVNTVRTVITVLDWLGRNC